MSFAVAAVLPPPAGACARPAERVLVRTPGEITRLSLDRFGQAAWVQVNAAGTCLRIHRGRLLGHQNRAITRCSTPRGPTPAEDSAVAIAATARSAGSPLHIAWAERFESNSETLATVWVPDGRGGRARVERIFVECGSGSCGAPGRILGPMAATDGIVLYAVWTWSLRRMRSRNDDMHAGRDRRPDPVGALLAGRRARHHRSGRAPYATWPSR